MQVVPLSFISVYPGKMVKIVLKKCVSFKVFCPGASQTRLKSYAGEPTKVSGVQDFRASGRSPRDETFPREQELSAHSPPCRSNWSIERAVTRHSATGLGARRLGRKLPVRPDRL